MGNRLAWPILLFALFSTLFWATPAHAANESPSFPMPNAVNVEFQAGLIAAAEFHTCVIDAAGGVSCWGDNTNGRLGDGTEIDHALPAPVVGLASGVVAVVAGEEHSCALIGAPGAVKCWGQRTKNGSDEDSSVPIDVPGLATGVTAISASLDHNCVIRNGGVLCWGFNRSGALGNGLTENSATPVQVVGLEDGVKQVSAGADHACALLDDGTLQCWGRNTAGQLGDGTQEEKHTPVAVEGLDEEVVEVAASGSFTCARTVTGKLFCWGFNLNGELGNGTTTSSLVPVEVQVGGPASAIAVSRSHSCALLADGRVQCWGPNNLGQLGTSCTTGSKSLPQTVNGISGNIIALQPGWGHTCTLSSRGYLYCWGNNNRGQVGLPPAGNATTPVEVTLAAKPVSSLALGTNHSCALYTDGSVGCWGSNTLGQLGNGTGEDCQQAESVIGLEEHVVAIAAGSSHTCALLQEGNSNDQVRCWGWNQEGQLGDETFVDQLAPVTVSLPISNVLQLVAGDQHTCVFMQATAGEPHVACWGSNNEQQVGASPTITEVVAIDAGVFRSCAILTSGAIRCWGYAQPEPQFISVESLGGAATAVADGEGHTCAIVEVGVRCWGMGLDGQLGAGVAITVSNSPTDVVGITGVAQAIVAGSNHTCALAAGNVFCWGRNTAGQLGNGTLEEGFQATQVSGLSGVTSLAVGANHTCAVLAGGAVQCWGSRSRGQVGDGKADFVATPYCFDELCSSIFVPKLKR